MSVKIKAQTEKEFQREQDDSMLALQYLILGIWIGAVVVGILWYAAR